MRYRGLGAQHPGLRASNCKGIDVYSGGVWCCGQVDVLRLRLEAGHPKIAVDLLTHVTQSLSLYDCIATLEYKIKAATLNFGPVLEEYSVLTSSSIQSFGCLFPFREHYSEK